MAFLARAASRAPRACLRRTSVAARISRQQPQHSLTQWLRPGRAGFHTAAPRFAEAEAAAKVQAQKVQVKFATPTSILADKEVDMVIIPTMEGTMGIMPNFPATVAELQPGVVSVHDGSEINKYFVSGGFAIVNDDSTCGITAAEAVKVDDLDPAAVSEGTEKYRQQMEAATDDRAKVEAQIGFQIHTAMGLAIQHDGSGA